MRGIWSLAFCLIVAAASGVRAEPPTASYIFPAGGQRGTSVPFRVGGLNLETRSSFAMWGPGIKAVESILRTETTWFEGPIIPLPDSQQAEDYPKDYAGEVEIAPDAPLGIRDWRIWTAQGACPAMKFVVGDLPEVVEREIEGNPIAVPVSLPVTVNGRIFPREDVDAWSFDLRKGQAVHCEVNSARLGSALDARLEVLDPNGHRLAENDDAFGADPALDFTAESDGTYQVRIHDINFRGAQNLVYRLTLSSGPWVESAYPLGGQRGRSTRFELAGVGLPSEPSQIALPSEGPELYYHRICDNGRLSNALLLELGDRTEVLESEPNNNPEQAASVDLSTVANGRIATPGDVDCWRFDARKGETYVLDLRARRLGSPLDSVLVVLDSTGKELARAEGTAATQLDPQVRFSAPADGPFLARVEPHLRTQCGLHHAYRLRLDFAPNPEFQLRLTSDALTLIRGKEAKLKVQLERLGRFAGPIMLSVDGLPAEVTASQTTIAAGQAAAEITFTAGASAPIRATPITIRGTAKLGEQTVTKTATRPGEWGAPEVETLLLAVAIPTPFKIVGDSDFRWAPRGTVYRRHYRIERGGYEGPIEVRLADHQARHLQGVTGPTIVVPPGQSEFDYSVMLAPWMETGRTSRSVIMGVGVVKDADGSTHEVSYSSVQATEQVVAVIEPGRLGVETDQSSIGLSPGETVSVPVRVSRGKNLSGPVTVQLVVPAHVEGIMADPVQVAADRSDAALAIHCGTEKPNVVTCPLIVRATIMDHGEPVVAETKVEICPQR